MINRYAINGYKLAGLTNTLAFYTVSPSVVPAGMESEIHIKPLGVHAAFLDGYEYTVNIIPMFESRYFYPGQAEQNTLKVKPDASGIIKIAYKFEREQEYYIRLLKPENAGDHRVLPYQKSYMTHTFHVYALDPDLYRLRPYRGDFHAHSTGSDGSEAPAFTAANYRKNGFDFFSLTDHEKMEPSLDAHKAYENAPVDFITLRGEEVHAPGCQVHIVNFGGNLGVNKYIKEDPKRYELQVQKIIESEKMPEGIDPFYYASSIWVFRKIRETGGLGIFAHPHWLEDVFQVPQVLIDAIFASGEMDVFELLGGVYPYDNNFQTVYFNEANAGKRVPFVGSSDSHGTEIGEPGLPYFTWTSTIVFTRDLTIENVKEAILNGYTAAVETYPGEESRVHASYRIMLYTRFLLNNYFPLHDEMCFEEGRMMKEWLLGAADARKSLEIMKGRVKRLQDLFWGI